MMKNAKKKIIRRLIIWLIALIALACLVVFVFVPIYSERDNSSGREPHLVFYEGDDKDVVIENDHLLLEMDAATTQFKITSKDTGKVWFSNPEGRDKDPIAHGVNSDLLSSTLNLTYTVSGSETELNNYRYSMVNRNFNIYKEDENTIRIEYAIGKIERTYFIPLAITKERYKELTGKMSGGDKKKVSSFYSLYDAKQLKKATNLDELKAMYPAIEEGNLYILKANTDTKSKEKIEGYFSKVGYDQEQYEIDMQNVEQKEENHGPYFNATMIIRLDGDQLVVEVPYNEIKYEGDYPLTYVSVLPMFGAAGTDQEGFIFIPEGSGGIIKYNNGKLSQNAYYANLYGWDYGMERTEAVSETENTFAVFGMGQPDGSFICTVEGASSYGGICADIAGRFNSFNTVYCKYNLIHYGQFKLSGRTNEQVLMYENTIPDDTIIQRYCFVDADNYVGMAEAYGDYLRSKPEFKQEQADPEVPIHVELVGAINKMVPVLGVPVDSVIPVTTFSEAQDIMNELLGDGVKHLNIRMTGWSNGGVRQKVLTGVNTVGQLGGDSALKKLITDAKGKGVSVYLDGISCFAYNSDLTEGFVPTLHAARFTTRELVKLYPYYIVNYQQMDDDDDLAYYLVKPRIADDYAKNLVDGVKKREATGVAFRDIGNLLSADYYKNDTVTREQVKEMNIGILQKAQDLDMKISIKKGNDYAIAYADLITDMNLTGRKYTIIDQAVPFYQIALHGLRNYTGEAINLSSDYRSAMLESAEYGAGLNFTFMKADTSILQDSAYSCYTAGSYDRWKEDARQMILRYQKEMSGLNSRRITGHEFITNDVHVTTYEDGTSVYVNYGRTDYKQGSLTIPARDYLVERGSAK